MKVNQIVTLLLPLVISVREVFCYLAERCLLADSYKNCVVLPFHFFIRKNTALIIDTKYQMVSLGRVFVFLK